MGRRRDRPGGERAVAAAALPLRGPAVRAAGLPLPPARMPPWRGGRPLKRWRWVGVFAPDLMLCAAHVRIGPLAQRFWALALPDGTLRGATATARAGGVRVAGPAVRVAAAGVRIDVRLDPAAGPPAVESLSPSGRAYAWTRKVAGVPARGTVELDGARRAIDAEAVLDDSAGYHARRTAWRWSAGVGRLAGGERLGWNLVAGMNDDPEASERTLWVAGEPREVGPVTFSDDLRAVRFAEGGELRCAAWAVRAHDTNAGLVRSRHAMPFGAFEGELPGGLRLTGGRGVMERHDVRW